MNEELELLRDKKGFICDMDGVIYHGNAAARHKSRLSAEIKAMAAAA